MSNYFEVYLFGFLAALLLSLASIQATSPKDGLTEIDVNQRLAALTPGDWQK